MSADHVVIPPNLSGSIKFDFLESNLAARTATDAIRELHAGLTDRQAIHVPEHFLRDLLARHALGVNCLNVDVAFAHARTAAVNRFVLALGRSTGGIDFDHQHPAVRLVFLIGGPSEAVTEHLRWTARLVRSLRGGTLLGKLIAAPTPAEFVRVLKDEFGTATTETRPGAFHV